MRTLITFLLLSVLGVGAYSQTIYIDTHLPNSHPMKKELLEKLHKWGKVTVVNLPDQADLILQLDQTDKLGGLISVWTVRGNAGCAVLKDRRTGEELWSETHGGAWQMSGWSTAAVGRKLGDGLVRFLSKDWNGSASRHPLTDPSEPGQTAPTGGVPAEKTEPAPATVPPQLL